MSRNSMRSNIQTLKEWLKGKGKLTSTPTPIQKQHNKQSKQPRFIKGMKR